MSMYKYEEKIFQWFRLLNTVDVMLLKLDFFFHISLNTTLLGIFLNLLLYEPVKNEYLSATMLIINLMKLWCVPIRELC